VFAGTTEGFWRSAGGGTNNSWMVTTSRQIEINSIAVHPSNPNAIFIGTNNYGVMVSTDGGKNFVPSNNGFSGRFVNAILPDRENLNRVYATTINTATGGGFFFVSSDGGASWQPSMRNMPPRLIGYSIFQDERDGNVIYLGTNLGVYRSADRGTSWAPVAGRKPAAAPARKRPPVRRTPGPAQVSRTAPGRTTGPGSSGVAGRPGAARRRSGPSCGPPGRSRTPSRPPPSPRWRAAPSGCGPLCLFFARLLHAWPGGLLRLFSTDRRLIEKYLDVPAARLTYREYFRWFLPRAFVGLHRVWLPKK
jgi:hypothetical protein